LAEIPLVWKSALQTETTLSTMQAEYFSLSHSLRTLMPIKFMLTHILEHLDIPATFRTTVSARAFEDNSGALALATNHRITNNTRYYNTKWHHFWEHVNRKELEIVKIDTSEQRADYLTKGLTRETFERIRKLVQGW
jgi:hypothetical protein